ncbi:hypothetical protein [Flavobacterium sp.]|uniref:hypothetical protein n=1 Tax=Flavobacterium sp. TaxID=239 RepID=UPI003D0AD106
MAFELKSVVPWGRSLEEYIKIFKLTDSDLNSSIISFGDGPASFNSEMTKLDKKVVSLDPIYQFTKAQLEQRIDETKETVIKQTRANQDNFVWKNIKNVDELEQIRMSAMANFIVDFEIGKEQQRYIYHQLPTPTKYEALEFDLGLSSHFLILYSQLGLDFHIQSISEMLRICKEIRIFPLLNLNAVKSEILEDIINHFNSDFIVTIESSDYEFQKNGNETLVIKRKKIN